MVKFNGFVPKQNLKNKATSNLKLNEVLKQIGLDTKMGISLRDGPFSTNMAILNLHPTRGSRWVCYIKENYFDSYAVVYPKKLSKFIIRRTGYFLYVEYEIQEMIVFGEVFVCI